MAQRFAEQPNNNINIICIPMDPSEKSKLYTTPVNFFRLFFDETLFTRIVQKVIDMLNKKVSTGLVFRCVASCFGIFSFVWFLLFVDVFKIPKNIMRQNKV